MINLQLFAEETLANAPAVENGTPTTETEAKAKAEVDIDARIEAAVSKISAKMEADFKKREAAKKEAQRLEKMSEEERQKVELERARGELSDEKAKFEHEKIKYEASRVLVQRNLPIEFTEYLIGDDNEKTLERITTFEKKYKAAIENGVNERLKGRAPAAGVKVADGVKSTSSFSDIIRQNQARR